jgi:hypothetical protein
MSRKMKSVRSKVEEILILSEPCIQFTDAKNCRGRLHFQSIRTIVFYAVNIAKNAESNVESIRNSDTFEAFYSLNMPKLESGCPRYRIEILIHSGPFIPRIAVIGCQRSPILPGLKHLKHTL